jgi:hypothetical protein
MNKYLQNFRQNATRQRNYMYNTEKFHQKAGLVDNKFYTNDFLLCDCPHTRLSTPAGLLNECVKKCWEL